MTASLDGLDKSQLCDFDIQIIENLKYVATIIIVIFR